MSCVDLSPAIGREGSRKAVSVTASRGPSDDGNLTEWRSDIIARCKADKEVAARRKARPEPLIPSYSVTGFGAPLARDEASGSSNFEGPKSSDANKHVSTGPVRGALLSQDSLDMMKLEERRRKLSDDAIESQGSSLGLEPAAVQLVGPIINLAASPGDEPLSFEVLQQTEVIAVYRAQYEDAMVQETSVNASSSHVAQLQHSAAPSSPPAPANPSSSSFSSPEMLRQIPAPFIFSFTHLPASAVDRLLRGRSATETRSRCQPKPPALPLTRNTRVRQSKQMGPALCQPLLSRTCSADTLDAAIASAAHMHADVPLQDVDIRPCCGVCQRLSSSLSAIWRWLSKPGSRLVKLSRKVRKQLMTALGFHQEEEMQRFLVVQQAEEMEPLTVRAYRPQHYMEEPQGRSRLQRWRM